MDIVDIYVVVGEAVRADDGGAVDERIHVAYQLYDQILVTEVTVDEPGALCWRVAGATRGGDLVGAEDLMAGAGECGHDLPAGPASRTGYQDAHFVRRGQDDGPVP